ncbi:MAG TPA: hypothetical protein VF133_18955 [Terriglobales bacterium]
MESISRLVGDSLARHGIEPSLDHLRLEWSKWFRCESSFSVLLVPAKAGIFALAEEIAPAMDDNDRKRMLALFEMKEADDLGLALGRLFLPGNPLREKLETGKCFARYAVIEEPTERAAAYDVFQRWMKDSAEELISRGAA